MNRVLPRLLLAAIAGSALDARATIVVDPGGQGDVTTLHEALALAADGELILLKTGGYGPAPGETAFVLGDKSLWLVADAEAHATVASVRITGLAAGKSIVLRGLDIDPAAFDPHLARPGVQLWQSAGAVWLEDCTIRGTDGFGDLPGSLLQDAPEAGVYAYGGNLVMNRCDVTGGRGTSALEWGIKGAPGVILYSSTAAANGCSFTGGAGADIEWTFLQYPDGGAGFEVFSNSLAVLSGSLLTGGQNGVATPWVIGLPGPGLMLRSATAFAWGRDNAYVFSAAPGSLEQGEGVMALKPENLTTLPAPSRGLSVTSPLREGEAGSLQAHGLPGDQLVLLASPSAACMPLLAKQGALMLDAPAFVPLVLGSIPDPGGVLTVPFTAPHLGAGIDGLTVLLQLGVVSGGDVTLEGGSAFACVAANA